MGLEWLQRIRFIRLCLDWAKAFGLARMAVDSNNRLRSQREGTL